MSKPILALAAVLLSFTSAMAASQTMRLDYYHTGDATQEVFSGDRVVIEPLPWPGDPAQGIDSSNLGKYVFEVRDSRTKQLLYSRGFASIYGEWETTDEAKTLKRTFQESLRFPAPTAPVNIVLKKRDAKNVFQDIWNTTIDPADQFVDRSKPVAPAPVITIQKTGEPETKVDFLIIGDGYTAAEAKKFEADARRLTQVLFSTSPFKENRKSFNVWALSPPAAESGVSRPSTGIYRDSPIGATYDAFGSERYVLTFDNHALRRAAQFANYVFVHEFGHHFAALADEYYTSSVAYAPAADRVEPWEPNVTALLDVSTLKWHHLVSPLANTTPIPTPWNKEAFEAYSREIQKRRTQLRKDRRPEEEMEALFKEELAHEKKMFAAEKHFGHVGAFEGAMYEARGYYRPEIDCIMFSRTDYFCRVCREAIERIIRMYATDSH